MTTNRDSLRHKPQPVAHSPERTICSTLGKQLNNSSYGLLSFKRKKNWARRIKWFFLLSVVCLRTDNYWLWPLARDLDLSNRNLNFDTGLCLILLLKFNLTYCLWYFLRVTDNLTYLLEKNFFFLKAGNETIIYDFIKKKLGCALSFPFWWIVNDCLIHHQRNVYVARNSHG